MVEALIFINATKVGVYRNLQSAASNHVRTLKLCDHKIFMYPCRSPYFCLISFISSARSLHDFGYQKYLRGPTYTSTQRADSFSRG